MTVRRLSWEDIVTHPGTRHCFQAIERPMPAWRVALLAVGDDASTATRVLVGRRWIAAHGGRRDLWLRPHITDELGPDTDVTELRDSLERLHADIGLGVAGDGATPRSLGVRLVILSDGQIALPPALLEQLERMERDGAADPRRLPPQVWHLMLAPGSSPVAALSPPPCEYHRVLLRLDTTPESTESTGLARLLLVLLPHLAQSVDQGARDFLAGSSRTLGVTSTEDAEAAERDSRTISRALRHIRDAELLRLGVARAPDATDGPDEATLLRIAEVRPRRPAVVRAPHPTDEQHNRNGATLLTFALWAACLFLPIVTWLSSGSRTELAELLTEPRWAILTFLFVAALAGLLLVLVERTRRGYDVMVTLPAGTPLKPDQSTPAPTRPAEPLRRQLDMTKRNLGRLQGLAARELHAAKVRAVHAWFDSVDHTPPTGPQTSEDARKDPERLGAVRGANARLELRAGPVRVGFAGLRSPR